MIRGSSTGVFNIDKEFLSDFNPRLSITFSKEILEKLRKTSFEILEKYEAPGYQIEKLHIQLDTLANNMNNLKCVAGIVDGIIYQNGDVSICEMLKPLGNLKDYNYNFYNLWNSKKSRGFIKKLDCSCMHNCNIVSNMEHDYRVLKKLYL